MSDIETERRTIVAEIVAKLDDDGAEITHETVAAKVAECFPGFAYDPELDDFTRASEDNPDAIRVKVRELDQRAADLRIEIRVATDERQKMRGMLAQCAADFQNGLGPKITAESNARDYLAASLAERAAHARGDNLPPVPEPGRSVVDRQAMYSGNAAGDASDHVRGQFRNGGFRRGSFPSHNKGRRLPSQRA